MKPRNWLGAVVNWIIDAMTVLVGLMFLLDNWIFRLKVEKRPAPSHLPAENVSAEADQPAAR